jgi:hypothetical protein
MKFKLINIFALLILFSAVKSQTFDTLIATDDDDIAHDAIAYNDGYLLIHNFGEFLPVSNNFELVELNGSGEIINNYSYPVPVDYFFYEVFKLFELDDGFLIVGNGESISTGIYHKYLLKLNADLSFQKDTLCPPNPYNSTDIISEVILNSKNKIVICGILTGQSNNSFIEIYNNEFELEIRKEYPIPYILSSIVEYEDYYYLFDYIYPYSFKCTKNDLLIFDSTAIPESFDVRNAIKCPNENEHILVGRSYMDFPQDPAFTHVSEEGEILTHWIYDLHFDTIYYYFNATTSFIDSTTFYMAGTYNVHENILFGIYEQPSWIMVNKLKTDGTIVWQKYFKGEVAYMPRKLLTTEDGGALILSTKYDWNNPILLQRDLHILRIDSTGWYDGITNLPEYNQPKQILIYPNPFHDNINIALGLYHVLEMEIFDHKGKLINQYHINHSKSLNLSHLPAGAYVYRFIKDGKILESGKLIKE